MELKPADQSFAWTTAGSALVMLMLATAVHAPVQAGPVVCTTRLEAPPADSAAGSDSMAGPVEVTRCAAVQTAPELVHQRFYTYTAPFERGIDLRHQISDLFGISLAGANGRTRMALGFPDQTIVWDGTALQNTYRVLLEAQSDPMPWRTPDLTTGFSASLGSAAEGGADPGARAAWPVRGLW